MALIYIKQKIKSRRKKNVKRNIKKKQRYNPNCARCNYSTKLLVPRNGTNVKESKKVEKRGNLLYNIIM